MSKRVEVVRAFYFEGAPKKPGTVLVVSPGFAAELISLGKAMPAPAAQDNPQPPVKRRGRRPAVVPNESELET